MPRAVGIVAVLVAGRDHQQAEAQDGGEVVLDPPRGARVVEADGEPLRKSQPALDLAQGQQAAIGGQLPAVEAGDQGRPATGDRPGSGGADATLAGMGPGTGWI